MTSKNIILFSVFHFLILIAFCGSNTSKKIPDHLLNCYTSGGVKVTSPLNVQLFIELFSKIEQNNLNYNIRTISSSILHSLRLDGILRAPEIKESDLVTPYRASSFQYAKYSFLLDLLIPGDKKVDLLDDLSDTEICTLHFLLSSTIDQWERGDELRICPLSMTNGEVPESVFIKDNSFSQPFINRTTKKIGLSRCPIEKGVIQTSWGDVAAGTLLAAISAALEPQNILLSDVFNAIKESADDRDSEYDFGDSGLELQEFANQISESVALSQKYISNVLAATLSGDLAEVIVRQGPFVADGKQNFTFGSWRKWNDSILPKDLYLMQELPYNFEMTDSEIIAGIDGYIIASHLKDWTAKMEGLRMSQIIEMYYSNYGVAFERTIRACNRKQNFRKLIANSDIMEQTLHMANFLWMKTGFVYMHSKDIERLSNEAVRKFEEYWPRLIDSLPGCDVKEDTNPMDAYVVTDGTWTKYQSEQFISIISETFDVSKHGSTMALLHGNTGEWASKPTNSLITLFDNVANYTNSWTNRLDFPRVLTSIVDYLENVTDEERTTFKVAGLPRVVIVIAPTTKMSATEIQRSKTMMNSLRSTYMDVYFTYFMKDEEAFKALAIDPRNYSDVLINHNDIDVREVAEKVRVSIIENVKPKRFIAPPCDLPRLSNTRYEYEDYINVGGKVTYRIHPNYMMYTQVVNVQFQGTDQGELSVCISRRHSEDAAESCKIFSGQYDARFQIKYPCSGAPSCNPVYFIVRARSATIKCSDKDCRYPDQIRYIIRHDGLECLRGDNTSGGAVLHQINFNSYLAIFTITYVFIYNKV